VADQSRSRVQVEGAISKTSGRARAQLSAQQQLLYASNRYAVLLIFQAMDAAGKDGAIRHVMSGVNPQGCQVFSFKHPSATELQHDFLWRTTRDLPERGRIGIFNRSYYEEVLMPACIRRFCAAKGSRTCRIDDKAVWHDRYRSIVDLEKHLHATEPASSSSSCTSRRRSSESAFWRASTSRKRTGNSASADIAERKFWKQYMKAYEECLSATSTSDAPWYVVPADDKENARLIVSQIVLDRTEAGMDPCA
jgi:PPK2 family polyphosphate:nucleotide phosphotransferase